MCRDCVAACCTSGPTHFRRGRATRGCFSSSSRENPLNPLLFFPHTCSKLEDRYAKRRESLWKETGRPVIGLPTTPIRLPAVVERTELSCIRSETNFTRSFYPLCAIYPRLDFFPLVVRKIGYDRIVMVIESGVSNVISTKLSRDCDGNNSSRVIETRDRRNLSNEIITHVARCEIRPRLVD